MYIYFQGSFASSKPPSIIYSIDLCNHFNIHCFSLVKKPPKHICIVKL